MQYKVPQGVDMQDRVLGPLTLVQFGIVLFGGLAAYLIYLKLPRPFGFWLGAGIFALSFLFSFDTSRRKVSAAISFILKPRKRIWHKELEETKPAIPLTKVEENKPAAKVKKTKYRDVSELAEVLDRHGNIQQQ